jgi:glycosyltransferase involved in cell wall biosynthesis
MQVTLFRDLPTERWLSMERYADELEAALRALGCQVRSFVLPRPWPQLRGRLGAWANYAWRLTAYPMAARSRQGDVNHILDHSYAHLIRALDARRTVVTCHDVAPLVFAKRSSGFSRRLWRSAFEAMFRAARVVTISNFSRAEILRHHPYPDQRLPVIGYGVNAGFSRRVAPETTHALRRRHAPGPRTLLLHVGTCEPRKNIETLLRALPAAEALDPVLVQVGGRFSPEQRRLLLSLGLEARVRQVPPAGDDELRAWYQAADALVFPSWYEGFGLPVLEAMASGTPVVCADIPSLAEVTAGAALLVDPGDASALGEALHRVLGDADLRQALHENGMARAGQFTWAETARQTLAVYSAVYQERA